MMFSASPALAAPTADRSALSDMREEARLFWADGRWTKAALLMHKADRLERGERTAWELVRDKRAAAARNLAIGVRGRNQQRLFAVKHKGTFTASQIGTALGVTRNAVIGWWHRDRGDAV